MRLVSDSLKFRACLMRKTIQIGNLDYFIDDRELARLFAPHGAVYSAKVSTHSSTGMSTGVGFVEMESDQGGDAAIGALNGLVLRGRILAVCWSQARSDRDATNRKMFGPMNTSDVIAGPAKVPERRGLP